MRHICIQYSLPYCYGILTNGLEWCFTRYSLTNELQSNRDGNLMESADMLKVVRLVKNNWGKEEFEVDF